jgi:hypothetical protein
MLLIFVPQVLVLIVLSVLFLYQWWKYDQSLALNLQGFGQMALLAKGVFVLLLFATMAIAFSMLMVKLFDEDFDVDYWILLIPLTAYFAGHLSFAWHELMIHRKNIKGTDGAMNTKAFVTRRGDNPAGPYYHLMDNPVFTTGGGKTKKRT